MYLPVKKDEKCTCCRACARICPKNVFEEDDEELRVCNPLRCTGCESCSAVCPVEAIKVEEI